MGEAKRKKAVAKAKKQPTVVKTARPAVEEPALTSHETGIMAFGKLLWIGIKNQGKLRLALLAVLLAVTVYTSVCASIFIANNSDAVVYPYLFMDGIGGSDMVVPGKHANILKYPLFWLQSVLPYNYETLMVVNVLLVVATVFGWLFLLMRIVDRKYHDVLIAGLILLLISSQSFNTEIIYNTVRNIEYPIALAFIMATAHILLGKAFRRRHQWFAGIAFVLL
jgi:hypothetical protein